MLSSIDRMRHSQIWNLLDQYADIRDHLEDVLYAMQMLQSQLASDIDDLSVDFDDLTEELNNCSKNLIRFKSAPDHPVQEWPEEPEAEEGLPFPDDDEEPFPVFTEPDDTQLFPWDLMEEEGR